MMATYPVDKLPVPVRDNYSLQIQAALVKREMDSGKTKTRRLFEAQPFNHNLTFLFDWDQYAYFEAFMKYDVNAGQDYFYCPIVPTAANKLVRFIKYPDATYDANKNRWQVIGKVEEKSGNKSSGVRLAYCESGYVAAGYWTESAPILTNGYPTFPTNIPEPEKDSYGIGIGNMFERSNVADGLATTRERFKSKVAQVKYRWILTLSQLETFRRFVYDDLYGGYSWFYAPFANGVGNQSLRGKFVELPTFTSLGAAFAATATIEYANIPTLTEAQYRSIV